MHAFAAKFGALALAPFLFFGGWANHMVHSAPTPPPYHAPIALAITGVDGPASLAIGEDGTWTVDVKAASTTTGLHYSVKWGDENAAPSALRAAAMIDSSSTFTHSYASAGTYKPEFTVTDDNGRSATKSVKVVVGAEAALHLDSVAPVAGAVGTSVTASGEGFDASSTITVGGIAATDVVLNDDGTIAFTVPQLRAGTYNVRVHEGDKKSNAVSFKVVAASPAISINGLDAPIALTTGEDGTWTVHVGTTADNLHYSVVWGDEASSGLRMMAAEETLQASSTFTHAYQTAGTYTPKFTVSDDNGHSESVSASVKVSDAE